MRRTSLRRGVFDGVHDGTRLQDHAWPATVGRVVNGSVFPRCEITRVRSVNRNTTSLD